MSVTLLGSLLLAVSLVSVVIYMASLGQLLIRARPPGMIRTSICRLLAALLYVGVGLITLETHETGPLVGLGVFTAVQLMWQANSIADVMLSRRLRKSGGLVSFQESVMPLNPIDQFSDPADRHVPANVSLSDAVVSAEIDRLSGLVTGLQTEQKKLKIDLTAALAGRRLAFSALGFAIVVAVVGLVFGLIVFERATNGETLAIQNRDAILEIKRTQLEIIDSVHNFCSVYDLSLDSYSPRIKATYPPGPAAYDEIYHRLLAGSDVLKCNLTPPPGLTR